MAEVTTAAKGEFECDVYEHRLCWEIYRACAFVMLTEFFVLYFIHAGQSGMSNQTGERHVL